MKSPSARSALLSDARERAAGLRMTAEASAANDLTRTVVVGAPGVLLRIEDVVQVAKGARRKLSWALVLACTDMRP